MIIAMGRLEPTRNRGAGSAADPPGAAASVSTFDAELTLIMGAKVNLDSGRGAAALAQLDEHARHYPSGVFAGEREALRILALCSSGRSSLTLSPFGSPWRS